MVIIVLEETFTSLKKGTSANTTWTISIKWNGSGSSDYIRRYTSAQLVFGKPLANTPKPEQNLATTNVNETCQKAFCLQSGDIVVATNINNNQMANYPPFYFATEGCRWNTFNNRSTWFKFIPSQPTLEVSLSGFVNIQQSVIVTLAPGSSCSSPSWKLVSCPTSMDTSGANDQKYFENSGKYSNGTGTRFNHAYYLTSLTPGVEYYLIVDGLGEDLGSSNTSNFYVELLYGADNVDLGGGVKAGCNRDAPLPISLAYFDGFHKEGSNQLMWRTSSETNNAFFIIEKSIDGENWDFLTRMSGAGSSNEPINYTTYDFQPFPTTYYRLTQQDIDGKFSVYMPIVVQFEQKITPNIYPNPANDFIRVPASTFIKLMDIHGKVLFHDKSETGTLDISHLNSGIYFLSFPNGETQKIIKQ